MKENIKIKDIFISFALVLVVISLGRSIIKNLKSFKRVRDLSSETAALKDRNTELREEIREKRSLDYIEEQARRRLGMVKEGEKVFIFPDEDSETERAAEEKYRRVEICYWREWLRAFGF